MIAPVAYASTFLSSACFGFASVLEQIGARRVKSLDSLNPLAYLPLLRQLPYSIGLLLDGLGFVLFVVAVKSLPLFFVQAVGTASIAVTALGARYLMKVSLSRQEYRLILFLALGLGLLSYASAPETPVAVSAGFRHWLFYLSLVVAVICAAISKYASRRPQLTAFMAGVCFSGVAVASRILPSGFSPGLWLGSWQLWALLIYGTVGILLFSMALQSGSVTRVYAINFVTDTVIPTVIGLSLMGDAPRQHLWTLMIIGLIVTMASTSALALAKDYTGETA